MNADGMTYSVDFRRLAFIKLQKSNGQIRKTAKLLEISPSTVSRWARQSNWYTSNPPARKRKSDSLNGVLQQFYAHQENCGTSLAMFHQMMKKYDNDGTYASLSTFRRRLKQARYSRKRLSTKVLGKVSDAAILEYERRRLAVTSDGPLVVSVDECNFSEKVQPLFGYSPIGQKCRLRNKKGGWTSYSLILCIASNGTKYHTILKGSVKRVDFARIVLDMPFPKGTVILMDNCTIHNGIDDTFKAKGFTPLFLSPYSPQFQPVELAFSKVKGHFRQLWPWTDGVTDAIEKSVNTLIGQDNRNFFKHASKCLNQRLAEIGDAGCAILVD